MAKITKTQLAQLKKRYMAEGYKMAKKKMLKEYYTDDGEHYFEYQELKEFKVILDSINRLFKDCEAASMREDYTKADTLYEWLTNAVESALGFLKDN